jgi:hypothetical protein
MANTAPLSISLIWKGVLRKAGFREVEKSAEGKILQVHEDREVAAKLQQAGRKRAKDFSWKNHVESVLALARELVVRQR